jgi:hypothetical protein
MTSEEVGGTVDSHRKPIAIPNAMALTGEAGITMNTAIATARPR